jgi:hypothetical protein
VKLPSALSLVSSSPPNRVFSIDFLQKNTSLQKLDLWDNKIGDEGASAIAEALKVDFSAFSAGDMFFVAIIFIPPMPHPLRPKTQTIR